MKLKRSAAAVLAMLAMGATVHTASAEPASRPGYDDAPDQILGGGSDTTYFGMQGIDRLYNRAPGCKVIIDGFARRSVSFSALKSLQPEFVKVDGAVVRKISSSPVAQLKLKAIARVCAVASTAP